MIYSGTEIRSDSAGQATLDSKWSRNLFEVSDAGQWEATTLQEHSIQGQRCSHPRQSSPDETCWVLRPTWQKYFKLAFDERQLKKGRWIFDFIFDEGVESLKTLASSILLGGSVLAAKKCQNVPNVWFSLQLFFLADVWNFWRAQHTLCYHQLKPQGSKDCQAELELRSPIFIKDNLFKKNFFFILKRDDVPRRWNVNWSKGKLIKVIQTVFVQEAFGFFFGTWHLLLASPFTCCCLWTPSGWFEWKVGRNTWKLTWHSIST